MTLAITATSAPALGDLRAAGRGDEIHVRAEATERKDWCRYWEALGVAWARGATVVLMRGDEI